MDTAKALNIGVVVVIVAIVSSVVYWYFAHPIIY